MLEIQHRFFRGVFMVYMDLIIIFALVLGDYLISTGIARMLLSGGAVTLIEGFIGLRYRENTGMAFSILRDHPDALMIVISVILVGFLVYYLVNKKEFTGLMRAGMILILAGGFSNLFDRFRLGYVIDYFEFLFFEYPIFNIADCFISVGAVLLVLGVVLYDIREKKKAAQKSEEAQSTEKVDGDEQ